ncbi:MAG TPA: hypothetical protein VLA89_18275 [Gemmatimonadales bacterium]|nr:hypothetical protein [Gemmatimonadales bacterium]
MRIPILLLAALLLPAAATAQADSAKTDSASSASAQPQAPVEAFSYTFTSPVEFIRVQLKGGVTYSAELNNPGVVLSFKPRDPGTQKPDIRKDMMGPPSASGAITFLVKPRADGEYEIRVQGIQAGAAVTLSMKAKTKS